MNPGFPIIAYTVTTNWAPVGAYLLWSNVEDMGVRLQMVSQRTIKFWPLCNPQNRQPLLAYIDTLLAEDDPEIIVVEGVNRGRASRFDRLLGALQHFREKSPYGAQHETRTVRGRYWCVGQLHETATRLELSGDGAVIEELGDWFRTWRVEVDTDKSKRASK